MFAFAGLWEKWDGADVAAGEAGCQANPLLTFTIVTTEPSTFMAEIHNRMPVASPDDLRRLFVPFTAERLSAHQVGRSVGNVRNDRADLIEPLQNRLQL